jgi:hypothetical protein
MYDSVEHRLTIDLCLIIAENWIFPLRLSRVLTNNYSIETRNKILLFASLHNVYFPWEQLLANRGTDMPHSPTRGLGSWSTSGETSYPAGRNKKHSNFYRKILLIRIRWTNLAHKTHAIPQMLISQVFFLELKFNLLSASILSVLAVGE